MWLAKFFTGAYYGKYDKVVHFLASAAIAVVLLTVLPWGWAAAAALGVGLAKEAYDRWWGGGRMEFDDVAVDALGIATVVALWLWLRSAVAFSFGVG